VRVRRRYQDGGRTRDLLRMLEQRQGPAPSVSESMRPSSLRVSREAPVYTSKDDAMLGQSRAGMQTFFGEERKPFDAAEGQGIKPVYPLSELTPAGDVKGITESATQGRFGEAAALAAVAWAPIPTETLQRMFKYVRDNFGDRSDKILDVISSIESGGNVTEGIDNTFFRVNPNLSEKEKMNISFDIGAAAEEMYEDGLLNDEIADHMQSAARAVSKGTKLDVKIDAPESIGPFKLQPKRDPNVLLEYRPDSGYGGAAIRRNAFADGSYSIDIVGEAQGASKLSQGKLMGEMIKAVPEGGIIDIPNMSTDSYPYMLKYIESGKAEVLKNKTTYGDINDMGSNPDLMARMFGVDPVDIQLAFNHTQMDESAEEILASAKRIKPKIDAKLKQLGLPESRLVDLDLEDLEYGDSPLHLPYPIVKKKIPTGTFYKGGSFRPVKKRRYQDGGRTADLLRMLEQQQVQRSMQDRMPQPSPAPASSTRVAMQPPMYTSAEDAMLDLSRAGNVTFFGEERPEFDPTKTQGIQMTSPLVEFLSPVGDIMAMGEADSGLEFAMAAGLAFLPGNLRDVKDFLPTFVRPEQVKILEEALGAVDDVSGNADELLSVNMPQLSRMSENARKEMANGLDEMTEGLVNFPGFSQEEVNRLRETSKYLRSPDIKQTSRAAAKKSTAPRSQIGDFKVEITPDGIGYRMDGSADYISLVENKPNDFTLVAILEENVNPRTKGLLLAETIKQVPKGGRVRFGSVNDLSTDSYVFPLSYIEKGKAKPDLSNVEFLKLNQLGQSPQAFAKAFDIEPRQVGLIDGSEKASSDVVARVKAKIDAKLQSLSLPESQVSGDQILMPHFDMIKTIGKGEFKYGGNLRVVKQAPKGFRTKR